MYTLLRAIVLASAIGVVASSAGAATLIRQDLEDLTRQNDLVVVGTVAEVHAHWNDAGTHIVTDVRITSTETLKGRAQSTVTVTLLGGTVGDVSTLVIGGPHLETGSEYVVFVANGDVLGEGAGLTIPFHIQGVFDVVTSAAGERLAVSQGAEHELLPDADGNTIAPGGSEGLSLEQLRTQVRLVAQEGE